MGKSSKWGVRSRLRTPPVRSSSNLFRGDQMVPSKSSTHLFLPCLPGRNGEQNIGWEGNIFQEVIENERKEDRDMGWHFCCDRNPSRHFDDIEDRKVSVGQENGIPSLYLL